MADTDDTDFQELIARSKLAGHVSRDVVDAAEVELGLVFPDQYREFVQLYGAALLPGAEIFGIVEQQEDQPPLWNDVRKLTKQLRHQQQAGADDLGFLPVSDDGTGVYFYLNTRAGPATEVWAVGPGIRHLVSSDFREFTVRLASGIVI